MSVSRRSQGLAEKRRPIVLRRLFIACVLLAAVLIVAGCGSTHQSKHFRGPIFGGFPLSKVFIYSTQEGTPELNSEIQKHILSRQQVNVSTNSQNMSDIEALEADLSGKALLVFGTPSGNAFLAKHLPGLPLVVNSDSVVLGDLVVPGNDLSIVTSWPNPQDSTHAS